MSINRQYYSSLQTELLGFMTSRNYDGWDIYESSSAIKPESVAKALGFLAQIVYHYPLDNAVLSFAQLDTWADGDTALILDTRNRDMVLMLKFGEKLSYFFRQRVSVPYFHLCPYPYQHPSISFELRSKGSLDYVDNPIEVINGFLVRFK